MQRMILFGIATLWGALAMPLGLVANAEAGEPIRLAAGREADVRLEGASTVGRWSCGARDTEAIFETDLTVREFYVLVQDFLQGREPPEGEFPAGTESRGGAFRVYVEIAARLLDCGNARMERDLQRAVRADEFPVISYWFTRVDGKVTRIEGREKPVFEMDVRGILVLANQPREVTHTARVRILGMDEFEVTGRLALKMTDFEIDPPRALFGLVRAHNDFEVSYRFVIRPKVDAREIPPISLGGTWTEAKYDR